MSVKTSADESLDKVSEHISNAIKELTEIVVNRCHGYNEYSPAYKGYINQSYKELIDIRDRLDR
jgi:hypothetical protein